MVRKIMLIICLSLLVFGLPVLAQDATPEATAAMTTWTCPTGFEGKTFTWFNWATYEADNTRSQFAQLCGLTDAGESIFGSNEELIAKLGQGNPGYDVITPTGSNVPQMIREGLLEKIDLSKIPNFANVSESLKKPTYDPNNEYTVPYQWGTTGVGYNTQVIPEITSWDDVWNFSGNVDWIDDPRVMLGIALHLLNLDPNTTKKEDIDQAVNYLIEHGKNVVAFPADTGQEDLVNGVADIVIEYSGDIFQRMDECANTPEENCKDKYNYVIPKEGSIRWVDNLAIPLDAPNPDLSMAFLDYILDPQVGADISNYTAYASPNQKAIDDKLIDESYLTNPIIYPTAEVDATLFTVSDMGDEAAKLYTDAWTQVKTALSNK
jgi:spermidine/putrescine transport system substrate-binding protein